MCTDERRRIWRGLRERVRDALRDSVRRADVPRAGCALKRAGCAGCGRRDREGGALVLAASERFGRRCRRAVARYVPPKSGRAADQDEDEQPDDPHPARHGRSAALRLLEPRARLLLAVALDLDDHAEAAPELVALLAAARERRLLVLAAHDRRLGERHAAGLLPPLGRRGEGGCDRREGRLQGVRRAGHGDGRARRAWGEVLAGDARGREVQRDGGG